MLTRKILVLGVVLAVLGIWTPGAGFAQQASRSSSQSDAEDREAVRDFAQRMMRRDLEQRDAQDEPAETTGGSINVQVIATADERTNSVVVRGPAEMLDLIADVLATLDDTTAEAADVRVYQLRYADAMNVAQVINQLFGAQRTSSRSQQDDVPFFFRRPDGGRRDGDDSESSKLQVAAAADSRTNSVVVTGPTALLTVVDEVVKNLDSQIPNVADVKVFHLEYADAQDTAELINEVFSETGSSRSSRSSQQQQVSFRGPFGGGSRTGQSQTGYSDVEVTASADSRTNSVVVSGPPETLAIIADVVKELDENPEQERRIFVYALKNATATSLMEILNNLFFEMQALEQQGTGRTGQQFQGAGGGQRSAPGGGAAGGTGSDSSGGDDLSEETYFEADPDTNSLLVMTSSKNYEKIKPILDELDKPVGQVLIKVLFAEVTHSDSLDLGTEFSMLNLRAGGGSTETIQIFGKPTELTTMGGSPSPTGLAVRTIEGDLDITIRALQETGKLNVLSRPYVLTSNNQLATITVGQEIPVPTGTSLTNGQSQTTFDYRDDIGIVLEVTPSINPLGLVNMVVSPKITTRLAERVQVSDTISAEAFATRSASMKVAVQDGQTVVIGGLIEDQITETIKKVPLVGDIPIIGELFRRTEKGTAKTELLIFLTPHVALQAEALTPISEAVSKQNTLNEDRTAAGLFKKHMEAMKPIDPNEP